MAGNIKAKLKFVKNIYPRLLKHRLFEARMPILVSFGITNKCNLKCNYCFVRPEHRNKYDLPTKQLLDYIDQFIDLGAQEINIQGGEPTLHPDLGAFISRVVNRGAACSIATNGLRVERYLSDLKKCYVVCISIDGLSDTTDANRGEGAYKIAVRALDLMANSGINVRIHSVLTYKTRPSDIDHLVVLAKRCKTSVNFVYAMDTGVNSSGCDDRNNFLQHIKETAGYMSRLKKERAPIVSKDGAINQVLKWPFGSQEIIMEDKLTIQQKKLIRQLKIPKCLWGQLACFFNTDGNIYLCPRAFDREGYYIKITHGNIGQAFNKLATAKKCYMCGQMGDLSYSFDFNIDNLKTWLRF